MPSSPARTSPVLSISPTSAAHASATASAAHASPIFDGGSVAQPSWVQGLLKFLLLLVIVASIAIAGVMATAHARDRFWINIASGSWLALTWHADHGVLYPPLRDEQGVFAGTRYMPLQIIAHAAMSRITGEYLLSGRLIGFASALMWTAAIIALARQRGCPWIISAALAACVLASPAGIQGLCTIRSDGLALALQLWALWIVGRSDKPAPAIVAAILCALAFLAKLTAVWSAVAIGLWLLWRARRSLAGFVVTGVVVTGGALLILHMTTDGRMLDNLQQATASGWRGWGAVVAWAPRRMLQFIIEWSPTTWVLVSPAALAVLLAAAKRELNLIHLAWLACCATMVVMFADAGVGENHVLEIAAITAIAAGDLWMRAGKVQNETVAGRGAVAWTPAQMLLALLIGWSTQAAIKQGLWRDLDTAVTVLRSGQPAAEDDPQALRSTLAGVKFLSDDPTLAVMLDQAPAVGDAFIFRGFEQSHPEWVNELIARIASREFGVIALTREADPDSWWFRELFFGPRVTAAIAEHYQRDRTEAGFEIYLPRR